MSQQNIDICRRCVAALDTRELSDELAEELLSPDSCIEAVSTAATANKTYVGTVGAGDWITDVFEGFDASTHFEVEEVLADGVDFVVARVQLVGHRVRSGAPVMLRWLWVFRFRDGKITRAVAYLHSREALDAVGLTG
jgi:ketosteroid isomerase-like protein